MTTIDPADLAGLRQWFEDLSEAVNSADFSRGRSLVSDNLMIFGTFANDILIGAENAEANQWRNVWPKITGFKGRLDDMQAIISPDRLMAVGLYVWDSTGYGPDGAPFDRPGRATVTFAREKVGDPWIATHTHMSLFRGTPSVSYGPKGQT